VGKSGSLDPRWSTSRVELGVDGHLSDGTEELSQTSHDDLGEEQGEEDLDGCQSEEGKANVAAINLDFNGKLPGTGSQERNNQDQSQGDQDGILQV